MKKYLYEIIARKIRSMIDNGTFKYGSRFLSLKEMNQLFNVDRKTIIKAIDLLEKEKVLLRIPNKGLYVNKPDIIFPMNKIEGFKRLFEFEKSNITSKVIKNEKLVAGYSLSKMFSIDETDYLNRLERIRYIDNDPIAYEITYVRDVIDDFQNINFELYSLYDVMESNGYNYTEIQESIMAVPFTENEAMYLDKEKDFVGFLVIDISMSDNGEVLEYNEGYTNSDRIVLSTELT